jgi:tetratricopeptide (TPR) repeat protein
MLIGERRYGKLVWIQLYDTSQSINEEELRVLLREVKSHILRKRIPSGSARKFLHGKLVYYEYDASETDIGSKKIYCLFTQETKVGAEVKKSIQSIAQRGAGYSVYSARRFFTEMMDLILNPKLLDAKVELSIDDIASRIDNYYTEAYDVNELGQIISFLSRSAKLDWDILLEKIYFHVYESILTIQEGGIDTDPDEFLDAAYVVARRYQEIDKFRLALELYKQIFPLAKKNLRMDLETACHIMIGIIYKDNFPNAGEFILEALSPIKSDHLQEAAKTHLEMYYSLLGFAYEQLDDKQKAMKNYNEAIKEADINMSSPQSIAEAYNYLGRSAQNRYFLLEGARHYLTAASIAFDAGLITLADQYQNNASEVEIETSFSLIRTALILRMEGNLNDAEYRAWDALRYLIKAYMHSEAQFYPNLFNQGIIILKEAEEVLSIPKKLRKNRSVIRKIRNYLHDLLEREIDVNVVQGKLDGLAEIVDENIPLPPPTFMLLTLDGRLILMGKIIDANWEESEIEGVILGGILTAIMSLISEVTGERSLRTVDAGTFQIMIEQSDNVAAALLLDRDIPEFRQRLVDSITFVDEFYGETLKFWKGKQGIFEDLKEKVAKILSTSVSK